MIESRAAKVSLDLCSFVVMVATLFLQSESLAQGSSPWVAKEGKVYVKDHLVGIGTGYPKGALDVSSTTGSFIPPRMSETERDAMNTAPDGSLIFNVTTKKMNLRQGGAWVELATGRGGINACPTGMAMVGDPGKRGTFCIDQEERSGASYVGAMSSCSQRDDSELGRARLCSLSEWVIACTNGLLNSATDDFELVNHSGGTNEVLVVGYGSCSSTDKTSFTGGSVGPPPEASFEAYRCCY